MKSPRAHTISKAGDTKRLTDPIDFEFDSTPRQGKEPTEKL